VALREAAIGKSGIMSGRDLALVFSALRANDLVWSYVVNNYLKGKIARSFRPALLERRFHQPPGRWYCWYVRNTYLENRLHEPGKTEVLGYRGSREDRGSGLCARHAEDHIVPWRTAYRTTQLLGGDMRFVLGASGHIAGVVNPVSKKQAQPLDRRKPRGGPGGMARRRKGRARKLVA